MKKERIIKALTALKNQAKDFNKKWETEMLKEEAEALDAAIEIIDIHDEESAMDEDILKQIINTYGIDLQLNQAIEEMRELTKELCKNRRGKDNRAAILEEVADVHIMMSQIELMFELKFREIDEIVKKKLEIMQQRLKEEAK